ncbi:MAG: 2-(1,2-epoxy-1,2-dihydrophenyl)acetyl-CoA isomerase [Gemmatimonadales bacterium]|nr:2-(1,2-epoxy-1,2-dihydrophenyl)acetyl-CoA isomerase [Gemmatimonadales bacterium]
MATTSILYDAAGGVARITLNRPEVLNSFDTPMALRLQEALAEASKDEAVRAVYLTGAGRAFCAGQDLAEAVGRDGQDTINFTDHLRRTYNPIVQAIRALPKPVVCGVNGVAAGAGANIALACDIVVASAEASFLQAFINIGLVPDSGGTFFLPRLVGVARATAMMMLGQKIGAQQAQEIGLIYKVVPAGTLEEGGFGIARQLAAMPTKALGLIKKLVHDSLKNTLEQQLESEAAVQQEASGTADFAEGVRAFLAKRKPNFAGK